MTAPLVVVDADVLGRRRTGDETYVAGLLAELGRLDHGLRIAAITRFPELVPPGVEPLALPAGGRVGRLALAVPRLLGRVRPALCHFLYALPPWLPCSAVVTVQDLSFELQPELMGRSDRLLFRAAVRRAVRRAARVLTGSERTRADLVRVYGLEEASVCVTPYGVDPLFAPGDGGRRDYALLVGAVQRRKDPLAALAAAQEAGLPLVVAGPVKDAALGAELERRGARLAGYVGREELARLYRDAACLLFPSRFEGFGLPVLEAMASGTPVVCADEPALREVAGEAAIFVPASRLAEGIEQALAARERLAAAGLERAQSYTWAETARLTAEIYREVLGAGRARRPGRRA